MVGSGLQAVGNTEVVISAQFKYDTIGWQIENQRSGWGVVLFGVGRWDVLKRQQHLG